MTAVDWLISELIHKGLMALRYDKDNTFNELIGEAKEMEKQQIIDAYMDRIDCTDKEHWSKIIGEQYYNETFGGTTQKQALQFLADQAQELNIGYENELSDEEIKNVALKEYNNNDYQYKYWEIDAFVCGANWYREQLKTRKAK